MDKYTLANMKEEITNVGGNKNSKPLITIVVDFDGTVVEHEYPRTGKENGNCSEILKRWIDEYNVGIILDTMRSGKLLDIAVNWFAERGVSLYGVSEHPTQKTWTSSPKCYGQFSIDDRNVGCPLISEVGKRERADWDKIVEIFEPKLKELSELLR